jgi:propionyl-CoA carboxylase beta chain
MEAYMNSIELLKARKAELNEKTANVRKELSKIVDDGSFVEFNTFSFAKNEFYGSDVPGLGVVTGYATVEGFPVYVVCQNPDVFGGALSKANCDKICECLEKAGNAKIPVLYLLNSKGVQVGEGVAVLEGVASVLRLSNELKEVVPQIAVATGDVLGSTAILADNCDFTFVVGKACVSYASPVVLSASKEGETKDSVANAKNGLKTFSVESVEEVKGSVVKVLSTLHKYSDFQQETGDDFNRSAPYLNESATVENLISATFDNGSFIEMNKDYVSDVTVGIGRIGGIATAGIIMGGEENGVDLDLDVVLKIKNFASFVYDNELPVVLFVNSNGLKADVDTCNTPVMTELMNMLSNLAGLKRVTVVYGKAIGLGYSAFVSKAFGSDYVYAFAGAKISIMDGFAGMSATFNTFDKEELAKLEEKYADAQDAFNSAKLGCVDNVIEPEFTRQYVISALQMILN